MMSARAPCVLRDTPPGLHPGAVPQDDEPLWAPPKSHVILRSPRSGRLEGRTVRSLRSLIGRLVILLLVAVMLSGCGKKGVPQPPPDVPNTFPRTYPSA